MPTWDAAAEAKLFLGVLIQLKNAKLSLNYKELAAFMGPVAKHVSRLRKKAEGPLVEKEGGDAPTTPVTTPQKRKPGRPPRASPKKAKIEGDASAFSHVEIQESPKKEE